MLVRKERGEGCAMGGDVSVKGDVNQDVNVD